MLALPSVDGYEDTVADLVVDRLREMPFTGRVLDQDHLAGADLAGLAIARGDLHSGVEIDDVLAPGCRMPAEIVGRRDLAEDDAGRRQALGELARARLLDPLDLDVAEVRLAARVGVEVVDPHSFPPSRLPGRGHTSGAANLDASLSTRGCGWTPRRGLEAERRPLDQVPGQKCQCGRRRQGNQKHLPPRRSATEKPDRRLLGGPAVDIDPVG